MTAKMTHVTETEFENRLWIKFRFGDLSENSEGLFRQQFREGIVFDPVINGTSVIFDTEANKYNGQRINPRTTYIVGVALPEQISADSVFDVPSWLPLDREVDLICYLKRIRPSRHGEKHWFKPHFLPRQLSQVTESTPHVMSHVQFEPNTRTGRSELETKLEFRLKLSEIQPTLFNAIQLVAQEESIVDDVFLA